mmetsp:Transcript_25051/g.38292  ORF Transcript_25051/g.38292 Transcript_25051/m.38292 type:complete len:227 (-) Transcript_25051:169-849(-)
MTIRNLFPQSRRTCMVVLGDDSSTDGGSSAMAVPVAVGVMMPPFAATTVDPPRDCPSPVNAAGSEFPPLPPKPRLLPPLLLPPPLPPPPLAESSPYSIFLLSTSPTVASPLAPVPVPVPVPVPDPAISSCNSRGTTPLAMSLKKSALEGSSRRRSGPLSTAKDDLYKVMIRRGLPDPDPDPDAVPLARPAVDLPPAAVPVDLPDADGARTVVARLAAGLRGLNRPA